MTATIQVQSGRSLCRMPYCEPTTSSASESSALPRNATRSTGAEKSQRLTVGVAATALETSGEAGTAVLLTTIPGFRGSSVLLTFEIARATRRFFGRKRFEQEITEETERFFLRSLCCLL